MNPWTPVLIGLGGHLFIAGVVYGTLSQRVKDNERRLGVLEGVQTQIGDLLRKHGENIVRLETATKTNGHAAGRAH